MPLQKQWTNWNLSQWLRCLENRYTQEIQLGLSRVLEVAQKLKLQTPECQVITVGGTNGKGSTVAALEQIYRAGGYQVGVYTSPHLISFNERIKVNGIKISDKDLCRCFSFIEEERAQVQLTYFEMTTLAALLYFKQQHLDIIILEVGLGGRLDATNIIDSDLAIITTIDYDHQEYLGNNLEAIAFEKAGIIRANKPVIYADENPPQSIVERANSLKAPLYVLGRDYSFLVKGEYWELNLLDQCITQLPIPKIQLNSAAAALAACQILQPNLSVLTKALQRAMTLVFIPGRLQWCHGPINLLFDVSHNRQSVNLLANKLNALEGKMKIRAVFSALKDKNLYELIFPLKDCVHHWYPALLDTKRAASADLMISEFKKAEIHVETCYNSPLIAFNTAYNEAREGELILVYGSFYTVGQVMATQHQFMEQREV